MQLKSRSGRAPSALSALPVLSVLVSWLISAVALSSAQAADAPTAAVADPPSAHTAPIAAPAEPADTLVPEAKRKTLQARLARKMAREAAKGDQATFGKPQQAMDFYVNKRTGPIITRGPNVTRGSRALDPQRYLDAVAEGRGKPMHSTRNGRMVSATEVEQSSRAAATTSSAAVAAAAPGGLLGAWASLGPGNQGGRTRQLLIDPGSPDTMYAAAVGGGVWKSINGGGNWNQLTDLVLPNIAVASLAMDPKNSQILYAGTGEGVFNGDAIRGTGIFVTSDGGTTWAPVSSTIPAPGVAGDFSYVFNIVVSSRSSQRLYASTRRGLFRSNDGGASWTRLIDASTIGGCHDVVLQTKRAVGYIYVACGTFNIGGANATIHRALDTATSAFAPVFTSTNMGRTSLAIAPSDESIVYAMASHKTNHNMLGIWRSSTNGASGSWALRVDATAANKLNRVQLTNPVFAFLAECGFGTSQSFNQGWYDNVLAVDPTDPNRLWSGGVDLMRSDDGGANWGIANYWWFDQGIDPQYAHADSHVIRFHPGYDGVSNKKMYVASDGGVFRTDDARAPVGTTVASVCGSPVAGQVTWTILNTDYTTTQFYHGAVYPDGGTFFGGLQDNGTVRGTTASQAWSVLAGGDGGYTAVDTKNDANPANDVLFLTNTDLSIQRSLNGGATFANATTGITGTGFAFIAPFAMNSAVRQQLWTGGFDVWRTTNQATNWQRVGGVNATPGAGSLSAVATSPSNPNRVIIGLSDGFIALDANALATGNVGNGWITNSTQPLAAFVSSVAFDPSNELIVYATYETFGGNSVYRSANGGVSWTAMPGTGSNLLPRVPAHTVTVDPTNTARIYVGTDIGVYTSLDSGANWFREVTGFGNVSVEHLEVNSQGAALYLYAFTHGRGAWRVPLVP